MITKTFSTTDYNLFEYFSENRPITSRKVQKFVKNMQNVGFIPSSQMLVWENNNKYLVIDGQHRLEASKQLEIPVYFSVFEGTRAQAIELMKLLNEPQDHWRNDQWLHFHAESGNPDYQKVEFYKEKYRFSVTLILPLITNLNSDGSVQLSKGNIKVVPNPEFYLDFAAHLKENLKPYGVKMNRAMCVAFRHLLDVDGLDSTHMEYFWKNIGQMGERTNVRDYLLIFQRMINYNRHRSNHLNLVSQ